MKKKSFIQVFFCVLLWGLLLFPYLYTMSDAIELIHLPLKQIAYLFTCLFLLLLPAFFLKARTYFIVEGIFNFLLFPIEISSLYLNHQPSSESFLYNIYHTHWEEAKELLVSLYPIVLAVIALYVIYFLLAHYVKNEYLFKRVNRGYLIGVILGLWLVGLGAMFAVNPQRQKMTFKENIAFANDHVLMKVYKIFPYNIYAHSIHLWKQQAQIKKLQRQVDSFRFDLPPQTTTQPELYILIIGEAARYDHQTLNGYSRNTTPNLSSRSHLISFDSIYSQANLTGHSLPLLLTRATARQRQIAYQEKTLPEAFAQSGFDTYWFLKQVPYTFVQRALKQATYSYVETSGTDKDGNYDQDILPRLQALGSPQKPSMMVVHLLGSHFRYDQRYPEEFKHFRPTWDKDHFSYRLIHPDNKEWFVNAYDNSILYTDYVVSQIIEWADRCNQPAVVMYLSDHGESLWDNENTEVLHGSYRVVEEEYHIPFLIWYSDEYADLYPEKVKAMHSNKNVRQNTEIAFYSLLDIANIPLPNTQQKSICDSLQRADTLYVINGKGELDILNP